MSFGINGPNNIPAIQKSHHTNDGGAGNLGYFQQEKKKKDEKPKEQEPDVFEITSKEDNNDGFEKTLDAVGNRIKNVWLTLKKYKKNP